MSIAEYIGDVRTLILALGTLADLIFGFIGAVRRDGFSPTKFGEWYITNVIRYVGGYYLVLSAVVVGLPQVVSITPTLEDVLGWLGLVPAIVALGYSIAKNVQKTFSPAPPTG